MKRLFKQIFLPVYAFMAIIAFTLSVQGAERLTAIVVKVVDGDTLKILLNGESATVVLIGIDAPEDRKSLKAMDDAARRGKDLDTIISEGRRATKHVKRIVRRGETVTIEFDVKKKDRFGNLLGYVFLSNGKMLNEEIVRNGYEYPRAMPPNLKYQKKFQKAYREARSKMRGLWKKRGDRKRFRG